MQNHCIYLKDRKQEELHFQKQEHIFPAFVGGMHKLEQGAVSDEMNELFSKWELLAAQDSILTLNRMFLGPGKRGSMNPKKRGHAKIGIHKSDDGKLSLGYIYMGTPKLILQVNFPLDVQEGENVQIGVSIDGENREQILEQQKSLIDALEKYDGRAVVLTEKVIPEKLALLGYYNGRFFLGLHPNANNEETFSYVKKMVPKVCVGLKLQTFPENAKVHKSQVHSNFAHCMDMKAYFRLVAKVAFNAAAYLNGREFMLADDFDGIRNAIVTGEEIERYVQFANDSPLKVFKELNYEQFVGRNFHSVICMRKGNQYLAVVSFYGVISSMVVLLAENLTVFPASQMDGYVCDWEQQWEGRFGEFLMRIIL